MTKALELIPLAAPVQPSAASRRAAHALSCALNHPAALYVASLGPGSRRSMVDSLKRVAKFLGSSVAELPWHQITFSHVSALRSWLAETFAPATANRVMCALRGTLKFACRLGLMDRLSMLNAIDVPPVKGIRVPHGRSLTKDELARMFRACRDRGDGGSRDRALLAVLYGCGLRRSELSGLDVADIEKDVLRVRGKGNKERLIPMPASVVTALEQWRAVRGEQPGALFYSLAYRTLTRNRITPPGIYCVIQLLAEHAGIEHFTPHDLRRSYAGDLLDAGVDLPTVRDMMGHADVNTTAGYDRRGARARREAASKLDVPTD
jgi:site-specific recombinase XerD